MVGTLLADFHVSNGTGYAFLESTPWLLALVVAIALLTLATRAGVVVPALLIAVAAVAIAALEFAGTLADQGYVAGPGLPEAAQGDRIRPQPLTRFRFSRSANPTALPVGASATC